ncbi:hypothetical protein [Salinibacillus xinjiangensis]|uniref:Uncharacterized protein n=1 Tax=Salinibacillus xinjiangensis TaxID=1229268 RepID=A0A6G1X4U8_9BACI|nr:hypothetical protein [Salinibacillus xinjiangensis]MRG85949.1 hypothetical protein [Salinibacillus xinjiangensis]
MNDYVLEFGELDQTQQRMVGGNSGLFHSNNHGDKKLKLSRLLMLASLFSKT